jgi:hypothetical protein
MSLTTQEKIIKAKELSQQIAKLEVELSALFQEEKNRVYTKSFSHKNYGEKNAQDRVMDWLGNRKGFYFSTFDIAHGLKMTGFDMPMGTISGSLSQLLSFGNVAHKNHAWGVPA